jgi:hypothetical protein
MNTYIAIIGTFLAVCEIIRCVQNRINLRRQQEVFERECGHLSDITDQDLQIQREVYRMLYAELKDRQCNCKTEGGAEDG